MTTSTQIDAIGGGEFGYLIKGDLTHDQAVAALLASREWEGDTDQQAHVEAKARYTYLPGWYRKNPCGTGEYAWHLGDGEPGQRGSFPAVYLRSPW